MSPRGGSGEATVIAGSISGNSLGLTGTAIGSSLPGVDRMGAVCIEYWIDYLRKASW